LCWMRKLEMKNLMVVVCLNVKDTNTRDMMLGQAWYIC